MITMPFGKHRGTPLSEVPRGYLHWLYNQAFLREPLRGQIERVLFNRPEPSTEQLIDDIIACTVRSLDDQVAEGGT